MKAKLTLLFLFLFIAHPLAYSQSSSELKRRKKALTKEIALLSNSLKKTANTKQLSLKQINALNAEINLREQKIKTVNSEIRLLDDQISDNTTAVRSLHVQLKDLKKEYAAMVLFAFRNQGAYQKLTFVFASKDFNQAYKRLKYLNQFSKYRKKQAEYIQNTQKDLKSKIVTLDHDKKEKSFLLQDQQQEKQTLGKKKNEQSQVLTRLSQKEKKIKVQLTTKKKESARLNRAIQSAINREIEIARRRAAAAAKVKAAKAKALDASKPKSGSVSKTTPKKMNVLSSTPESARLSSSFLGSRGSLPWPVASGTIVEGFGTHNYGVNITIENNGIDIRTSAGAKVRAVFAGQVSTVQDIGGNYAVLVRHGEYFTVYSNLKTTIVSRGQKVTIKQSLGTVLTDPGDGTTQLHFEIRKGASPVNPTSWLAR